MVTELLTLNTSAPGLTPGALQLRAVTTLYRPREGRYTMNLSKDELAVLSWALQVVIAEFPSDDDTVAAQSLLDRVDAALAVARDGLKPAWVRPDVWERMRDR
jgi:hypothetical protein